MTMDLVIESLEDEEFEPTIELARETCKDRGHMPERVISDHGFTYDTICGRCGKEL